jgi:hypothetical protein
VLNRRKAVIGYATFLVARWALRRRVRRARRTFAGQVAQVRQRLPGRA